MNELQLPTLLLLCFPAALFLFFGAGWLAGFTPKERVLSGVTIATLVVQTALVGWLVYQLEFFDRSYIIVDAGTWFTFEEVSIHFSFLIDRISLTLSALTVVLVALVAAFSVRYMHRDLATSASSCSCSCSPSGPCWCSSPHHWICFLVDGNWWV